MYFSRSSDPYHSCKYVIRNTKTLIFFFFSSRRRHTRLQGDWSSDVCSSDLQHSTRQQIVALPTAPSECKPSPHGRECAGPVHRVDRFARTRRLQGNSF